MLQKVSSESSFRKRSSYWNWFDCMKQNCFPSMASKGRCYHQRKKSRTHLTIIIHYAYTMVQLSSGLGSSLVFSWAAVLLWSSISQQLQDSVDTACRPEAEYDATCKEGVCVRVQAWSSQFNGTNIMPHCTQGQHTLSSDLSSVFKDVVPIFQVLFCKRGWGQKRNEKRKREKPELVIV